jgi:hypothetical protein
VLRRTGKIKFEFSKIIDDARDIYFINYANGLVSKLVFAEELADFPALSHESVIVLGKFQYVRSRFISIDEITAEEVKYKILGAAAGTRDFECVILPTLDGKTFLPAVIPYDASTFPAALAHYLCHTSCLNFAVVFKGAFNLNTVELVFHIEGDNWL